MKKSNQYEIHLYQKVGKEILGTYLLDKRPTIAEALKLLETSIGKKISKFNYLSIRNV